MIFSSLPVELVCAIVDHLESESDISSLSRASRAFHQIVLPLLYQHNVRHNDAFALIDAVVCGNTAAIINALDLGGATMDMTFSTRSNRLQSPRLVAKKPIPSHGARAADETWTDWVIYGSPEQIPLSVAVLYNELVSAELLLSRYGIVCPETTLKMAAHLGRVEIARMLLDKGHCSIPPVGQGSSKLLYYAISGQDPDMIQLLFHHGLDMPKTNITTMRRPSYTQDVVYSLMGAKQGRFEAIIRLLASRDIQLQEWVFHSRHPMPSHRVSLVAMTVHYGQVEKLQFLVRSGLISGLPASEDVVMQHICAENADLLHDMARRGHADMVRYLLKHHASRLTLGQLDDNGMGTPLYNALSTSSHGRPNPDVVRALVEVFPARNGKSSDQIRHETFEVQTVSLHGRPRLTMLCYCVQSDHHTRLRPRVKCSHTLQVLIDAGANPFTVCGRGRNALRYALDSRCADCAKVLLARMGSGAAVSMMDDLVKSAGGGSDMTWQAAHDGTRERQHNVSEETRRWSRNELGRWHTEFAELVEAQRKHEQAGGE